jgi:hypothetical protein
MKTTQLLLPMSWVCPPINIEDNLCWWLFVASDESINHPASHLRYLSFADLIFIDRYLLNLPLRVTTISSQLPVGEWWLIL